jgi:methanogenic corrinoid protein MtbC1
MVLSVALIAQLEHLRTAIAAIREASPDTRILLGGLALASTPELWRAVGADGYASHPAEAVAQAAQLLGLDR